jgi:hypothetical protein
MRHFSHLPTKYSRVSSDPFLFHRATDTLRMLDIANVCSIVLRTRGTKAAPSQVRTGEPDLMRKTRGSQCRPKNLLRSSLRMELLKRVFYIAMTGVIIVLMAGCFSYHRDVRETSTPAVEAPAASSTTTTTSTNDNGTVERQSTTTYNAP